MRKLDKKKGIHVQCCSAKISLNLMLKPIRTLVETIVAKLAPFCIPRYSWRFGPSFLSGQLLKSLYDTTLYRVQ